jgi:hypothetical protein
MFQVTGDAEVLPPVGVAYMSEFHVRNNAQVKSLWQAAALILSLVFAPAAAAGLLMLLRHP